eukprot:CAMPEP_0205911768 /NCGR_PEP_ID=MMETSP1325-20131115/5375_1 /ASSEMBLY_ACC=CAM_ASM_000708 /TAXON_ID=236786 /ORGANISM="Florenciella sp., Strain RCC1007" /LENGTH=50 /DNA_ID=CAMNT_0053278353 /DNA_START=94 /DNA_END=244 /DNA_ORIENTATION=+
MTVTPPPSSGECTLTTRASSGRPLGAGDSKRRGPRLWEMVGRAMTRRSSA